MSYFVTGATGFIGRNLVEQLLEREGTIYVLIREGSRGRLEELRSRWGAEEDRIVPVLGDLSQEKLGCGDVIGELRRPTRAETLIVDRVFRGEGQVIHWGGYSREITSLDLPKR